MSTREETLSTEGAQKPDYLLTERDTETYETKVCGKDDVRVTRHEGLLVDQ